MTPFPFETPRTIGEGWREAPLWQPMPQRRDIATMCNTARLCVRIAIERACDDAKDALMLRSALWAKAYGLPLTSAQKVALEADRRKAYQNLIAKGNDTVKTVCEMLGVPPLTQFEIDPSIDIINWKPTDPTRWAPRSFEGGSNA